MKWRSESCESGDMIRVRVGSVWHYGIFVSKDEVIEFGPPPLPLNIASKSDHRVMSVSIEEFSAGGTVERALLSPEEEQCRLSPSKTLAAARSRIGEGGYDIIHNNCEHFATACLFGLGSSTQEEALRKRWQSRPILDVYVMSIPEDMKVTSVYPPERDKQIRETKNENSRIERYAVWTVLEQAIEHSFSLSLKDLVFTENKGKWCCDKLYFSLSHSRDAVAVAVSNDRCGVDIEALERFRSRYSDPALLDKMYSKICSPEENVSVQSPDDLIKIWTKKESIYKCFGTERFQPKSINSSAFETLTVNLSLPNRHVVSFCGSKLSHAHVYVFDGERFRPVASGRNFSGMDQ